VSDLIAQLDFYLQKKPTLGSGVYVAPGARLLGDVTLGECSSVWFNAVLRGDINRIIVGKYSNIQDNAVLHVEDELACLVGDYVTVGHGAIIHACTVENESLIGMGATILDGAVIGPQCIVGANSLVTRRTIIPARSLVLGAPARVVRALAPDELNELKSHAEKYARTAEYYLQHDPCAAADPPVKARKTAPARKK
jgi:gamma-carbonic anhydrase